MTSLRHLMVVGLMGLGFGSLQGMKGGPSVADFMADPQARDFIKEMFMTELLQNPEFIVLVKAMAFEYLNGIKGEWYTKLEKLRKSQGGGLAGKAFGLFDQAIGRKSFPIAGDDQLGEAFTRQEWAMACTQGNVRVIKHFLAKREYSHLLNESDGENKALAWAAFGFLTGEKLEGVVPTSEGFKLLAEDPRIDSKFLIRAGLGRIPFDEWLLHDAAYPEDASAQARLETLKGILKPTLSAERLDAIEEIRERKESQRRAQEALEAAQRTRRFNKISFVVGIAATLGALYYYVNKKAATPEGTPIAAAATVG